METVSLAKCCQFPMARPLVTAMVSLASRSPHEAETSHRVWCGELEWLRFDQDSGDRSVVCEVRRNLMYAAVQ